jgi:hypothetical protein
MDSGYRAFPRLAQLFDYWERKRAGRAMPKRSDIDPGEIAQLLPFIKIVEVVDDGARYRYRLVGTGIVRVFGVDFTGKYLDQTSSGVRRAFVRECYEAVRQSRRPAFAQTRYLRAHGPEIAAARLLAPLAVDDDAVRQIIGATVFDVAASGPSTGILSTDQIDRARSHVDVL